MENFNSFSELDILQDSAQRNNAINGDVDELMHSMFFPEESAGNVNYDLFQDDFMFLDDLMATSSSTAPANESEIFKTSMNSLSTIGNTSVSPTSLKGDWMLLPIPENLQNEPIINNLDSIHLETSTIDEINASVSGFNGVKVGPAENSSVTSNIVTRAPLQMIQQVIHYPAKKKPSIEEKKKESNKRKQIFEFPREDGATFYCDFDDEDQPASDEAITIDENERENETSAVVEVIPELPVIKKKKPRKDEPEKKEKCSTCGKEFKRISLHRCKKAEKKVSVSTSSEELNENEVKLEKDSNEKLLIDAPPSSPIPPKKKKSFKCKHCVAAFHQESELELHFSVHHEPLKCANCDFVAKNKRGRDVHQQICPAAVKDVLQVKKSKKIAKKKEIIKAEVIKRLRKRNK